MRQAACYPGADTYLMGAISVGVVASTRGAHLLWRATVGLRANGRGGPTPHRNRPERDGHFGDGRDPPLRRSEVSSRAAPRRTREARSRSQFVADYAPLIRPTLDADLFLRKRSGSYLDRKRAFPVGDLTKKMRCRIVACSRSMSMCPCGMYPPSKISSCSTRIPRFFAISDRILVRKDCRSRATRSFSF